MKNNSRIKKGKSNGNPGFRTKANFRIIKIFQNKKLSYKKIDKTKKY